MTTRLSTRITLVSTFTLALLGCGGATPGGTQTTSSTVGSGGATLSTASVAVSIPPGALSSSVVVTVRETEPHHAGRAARIELEPRGLALQQPAVVSLEVDDSNARVRMIGVDDSSGQEQLMDVEIEDHVHHRYKTTVTTLGSVEVELEHLRTCSPACGANEECDDGACKPHVESAGAASCSTVCSSGLECDDGVCKPHGGSAGTASTPSTGTSAGTGTTAGTGTVAACTPACATGLECDNGICKAHGGRR